MNERTLYSLSIYMHSFHLKESGQSTTMNFSSFEWKMDRKLYERWKCFLMPIMQSSNLALVHLGWKGYTNSANDWFSNWLSNFCSTNEGKVYRKTPWMGHPPISIQQLPCLAISISIQMGLPLLSFWGGFWSIYHGKNQKAWICLIEEDFIQRWHPFRLLYKWMGSFIIVLSLTALIISRPCTPLP